MATTPDSRGPKRPHPAWRARRVTAVVSGVAFVGLVGGMAIEASSSSAHAATRTPDVAPNDPSATPTEPWGAPQTVDPQLGGQQLDDPQTLDPQQSPFFQPPVGQRSHTQTSGS